MLHSRRSKFKRSMKAFGKYIRKPLGFLVTLYASLITLFGLAWVLFLIGWIYVGNKQLYVINVIDNVLVALFAIVGDGMIPFRLVDTYHMIFIHHYHHLTLKRRKKLALPKLQNKNDLPTDSGTSDPADLETARERATKSADEAEVSVLTPQQQAKLVHHQTKFAKSHTFYKPHETETHFAFPHRLLVAVVILLDLHSCFQVALGTCTWAINYHVRPAALTTTILCCSITVNTVAGILISIGDRRTRKKDVIERMFRQELTEEAMHKVQEHKAANEKREREGDSSKERLWSKSLDLPRPSLGKWTAGNKSDDSASEKEPRKDKGQVGRFDAATGVRDFQPTEQ
ncbi:putative integral membrane protein [Phaeoacremonium minimum UCRPA7]|uniref:Putative integral membrane protein n=1 Tax=Phaeoacremonium minimum (strain UCR-PA7) TaxID=1286976 RepID=R8BB55_PHAM7|nr:putative integral membrane protein [Phaeoacremonium minimum UCRPA7]EON96525.1 putative integral membrane protein [Phaeoacremonium minimum UCRPA7]